MILGERSPNKAVYDSKAGLDDFIVRLEDAAEYYGRSDTDYCCGFPWLDEEQLVPGRPWHEAPETIIETIPAAVVLIEECGLGQWEEPDRKSQLGVRVVVASSKF